MRTPRTDRFVPGRQEQPQHERRCEASGCAEAGVHKAPRSRAELRNYYWFCLDHVREYNKAWNYFAGLSDDEVELILQRDTTWDRPTWPLGSRFLHRRSRLTDEQIRDAFRAFENGGGRRTESDQETPQFRPMNAMQRKALQVLDLDFPVTLDRIKARYKQLVKTHHPDANGGDRAAEERLKYINDAYTTLRKLVSS